MTVMTTACIEPRTSTAISPLQRDTASTATMAQIASAHPLASAEQITRAPAGSAIGQVATDRRVDTDATPEIELAREPMTGQPDMALYRDVALAWQAIRARGQQPSPELLAQAVGPDNLATFLSTFRNADRMFRPDVDTWPVAPIAVPHARP